MAFFEKQLLIAYFSPAGSTARVAGAIQDEIESLGNEVALFSLTNRNHISGIISEMENDDRELGLFIGSPVYANRALPPVLDTILKFPPGIKGFAVPFVTWGGVCSGGALYEMGKALIGKGLPLLGALKVPAAHSLIWDSDLDPGAGHPDSDDTRLIKEFINQIAEKANRQDARQVDLDGLKYLPADGSDPLKNLTYEDVKRNYPAREIQPDRCTQCGICEDDCPVNAITMSPFPQFASACVYCYKCVRHCPEAAIKTDLSLLRERILLRAKDIAEPLKAKMWL